MAAPDLGWGVFLAAALCVPWVACRLARLWSKGIGGLAVAVAASVVLISTPALVGVTAYNESLDAAIQPLDRNGDDVYSADEIASWTPDEHRNLARWTGDGGRNVFAYLVAPVLSAVYSTAVGALYWLVARHRGRRSVPSG